MRPKSKSELADKAWRYIRDMLEERKISWAELLRRCEKLGYHVSQSELSKLYSGKIHLILYHLAAFSEILNIPTDYFLNKKNVFRKVNTSGRGFIVNPSDETFWGYMETYHTIFHSTSMQEEKILRGVMNFSAPDSGNICEVEFKLDTDEKGMDGNPILNNYQG